MQKIYLLKRSLLKQIEHSFPALSHRDFLYFWFGQMFSLIGTWVQRMGQAWLVYTLTNSAFKVGLIGALQFLPMMLFSLVAGVAIDHYPKKKIIVWTQFISMALAFSLSFLVLTDQVEYYQVAILAFCLGTVNAVDLPSRQSYMIELVGKEDLPSAVALNSTIFNFARVAGPAIAGVLMGAFNLGWCFFINGLSFLAVLYGLWQIGKAPSSFTSLKQKIIKTNLYLSNNSQQLMANEATTTSHIKRADIVREVKEGLVYIGKNETLLSIVIILFYTGTFAYNFSVLIPIMAKDVLGLKEQGFGFLMSSLGLGSLLGAILTSVTIKKNIHHHAILLSSFNLISASLLMAIGFFHSPQIIALLLFICGIFNLCFSITANTVLQLTSDDHFRGRVMSVYALVFAGTTPIGNLFTGWVVENWGVNSAFIVNGFLILLFSILIKIKIYHKLKTFYFSMQSRISLIKL